MPLTNIEVETLSAIKAAARKFANETIDWEQRRFEVAKDVLPSILSKKYMKDNGYIYDNESAVKESVKIADLLINELRNKKTE